MKSKHPFDNDQMAINDFLSLNHMRDVTGGKKEIAKDVSKNKKSKVVTSKKKKGKQEHVETQRPKTNLKIKPYRSIDSANSNSIRILKDTVKKSDEVVVDDNDNYEKFFKITKNNKVMCLKCNNSKEFKNRVSAIRHIRIKHLGMKYICPECRNEYADRHGLNKHLAAHHKADSNKFKGVCLIAKSAETTKASQNKTFKKKNNLILFEQDYKWQGNHFICLKCPKSVKYSYRKTIAAHLFIEHYGLKYVCPECDKEYFVKLSLSTHLKKHHNLNINELKSECYIKPAATAENSTDLDLNSFADNSMEECNENSAESNSSKEIFDLDSQKRFSYGDAYMMLGNYFICLKCNDSEKFKFRQSVIRHVRKEHLGLQYVCPICSKEYFDRFGFQRHIKVHHQLNLNRLECNNFIKIAGDCNEQTNVALNIKEPELCYENFYSYQENHFVCLKCADARTFKLKESIVRHIRIKHFGIRYQCFKCQNRYLDRLDLQRHLRKQHMLKPKEAYKKSQAALHINPEERKAAFVVQKKSFTMKANFIKRIAFGIYQCLKCRSLPKFKTRYAVTNHIQAKHNCGKYICPKCKKRLGNINTFKSHMRQEHKNEIIRLMTAQTVVVNELEATNNNTDVADCQGNAVDPSLTEIKIELETEQPVYSCYSALNTMEEQDIEANAMDWGYSYAAEQQRPASVKEELLDEAYMGQQGMFLISKYTFIH